MTVRNITLKKINAKNVVQEIDDSLTVSIELFLKTATLIELFKARQTDDKAQVKADKQFAFMRAQDNTHRLSKQVRQYQRNNNIRYSSDNTLTHYVYAKKRIKIDTRNVKVTEVCNTLKVFHLYEAKRELSDEDFSALVDMIAAM